jgi:hypothetical protein
VSHFEGSTWSDIVRKEAAERDIWSNGGGTNRRTFLSPVRSLEWPRGFQEIKVFRFHDNGT